MTEHQSSYRQIMKATSIFGGVQVFNILISIVRSKFVAVLLGPAGMGIMGLLTATTGMMGSLTNFGLGTSAVKDIAAALGTNDIRRVSIVVGVIRRLVWLTGLLGLVSTAILSPWLSQITFGNKEYTLAFIWLSVTLLFNQLSSGQLVLLQGMRKLKHLAQANLSGSFVGLFVTLPLYYVWGIDGIVPGMIASSLLSLVMSWYFSGKTKVINAELSASQTLAEGRNMLQLGFIINLSLLFTTASSYLIRIFINHSGGVEQVGLYNAGFVIINTYVGLIFNAMGTDYLPRLSAVSHDNQLCRQTINQQAEIAILILAPILVIFFIFIHWVVVLLYSKQFEAVTDMIYWAALGMFFKAVSWSVAFIFLAKGSKKIFFWLELIYNALLLALNVIGYYLGGLSGLGLSFAIYFLIYLVQVYLLSRIKFQFSFSNSFLKIFVVQFGLAIAAFLSAEFFDPIYKYIFGVIVIGASSLYSIIQLDKRMGILSLLKQYKSR